MGGGRKKQRKGKKKKDYYIHKFLCLKGINFTLDIYQFGHITDRTLTTWASDRTAKLPTHKFLPQHTALPFL